MFDYDYFKGQVKKIIDLDLNFYKEQQMKRRIDSIVKKNFCNSYEEYLQKLRSDQEILDEFVSFLTINVTEFYRNPNQWEIFENRIVPYLIRTFGKSLNIWSAACSNGSEPYTVAMILAKYIPTPIINIYASDIDKRVLIDAQRGLYDVNSLKGLPVEFFDLYFSRYDDKYYKISDTIKKCVSFHKHDLLKDPYPADMHLILCRNVMIYMTNPAKEKMYAGFNASLKENGIFFIGSTENIIRPQNYGFENVTSFFYKKK